MNIETVLLLLEFVLLIVTIVLLFFSIHEGRQRSLLLIEVGRATRTLNRAEYFQTVVESINLSSSEVISYVTGHRLYDADDERRIKEIIQAIKSAVCRGVVVRCTLPKFHDRLYMGFLYAQAGAEVRFTASQLIFSLRYTVIDSKLVVIGIPDVVSELAATSKGHRLPSEALAQMIRGHFYEHWNNKSPTLSEYLQEILEETKVSLQELSLEVGINVEELKAYLAQERSKQS